MYKRNCAFEKSHDQWSLTYSLAFISLAFSEKKVLIFPIGPYYWTMASGDCHLGFSNKKKTSKCHPMIINVQFEFHQYNTYTLWEHLTFFSFFIGFHVILCQAGAEWCFFPTDEKTNFLKHHGLLLYVHCHQWTTFWENICYIFP